MTKSITVNGCGILIDIDSSGCLTCTRCSLTAPLVFHAGGADGKQCVGCLKERYDALLALCDNPGLLESSSYIDNCKKALANLGLTAKDKSAKIDRKKK